MPASEEAELDKLPFDGARSSPVAPLAECLVLGAVDLAAALPELLEGLVLVGGSQHAAQEPDAQDSARAGGETNRARKGEPDNRRGDDDEKHASSMSPGEAVRQ